MPTNEEYNRLLDEMLSGVDLTDETACRKAYQHILNVAQEQFSNDLNVNSFTFAAAKRLRHPAVHYSIIQSLVELPLEAALHLSYADNGPILTGNDIGLRYIASLAQSLAECEFNGEHVHLYNQEAPLVGWSFPLTIYRESNEWFDEQVERDKKKYASQNEDEHKGEIQMRDIIPEQIAAFSLIGGIPFPPALALRMNRIYKVIGISHYEEEASWAKTVRESLERMFVFDVIDDDGKPFNIAFDLDDKEVAFFTRDDVSQILP